MSAKHKDPPRAAFPFEATTLRLPCRAHAGNDSSQDHPYDLCSTRTSSQSSCDAKLAPGSQTASIHLDFKNKKLRFNGSFTPEHLSATIPWMSVASASLNLCLSFSVYFSVNASSGVHSRHTLMLVMFRSFSFTCHARVCLFSSNLRTR